MRVSSYIFLVVGLMMIMNLAGVTTYTGYLLGQVGVIDSPEDVTTSGLFNIVSLIFAGVAVGGVVIGFLTKTSPESYLLAGYAGILILFAADIMSIVSATKNAGGSTWAYWVVATICVPIVIGYIHAVVSWWGGKTA